MLKQKQNVWKEGIKIFPCQARDKLLPANLLPHNCHIIDNLLYIPTEYLTVKFPKYLLDVITFFAVLSGIASSAFAVRARSTAGHCSTIQAKDTCTSGN